MFKRILFAFIIIAALFYTGQAMAGEDEYVYTVQTTPDVVHIQNGAINIQGGEIIATPGAPRVGYKLVKLALPPDKTVNGFAVTAENSISISTADIDYVVGDIKTGDYPPDTASMPDPVIYGSDDSYPAKRAEIKVTGEG